MTSQPHNFSQQNLRGYSFKERKDLIGADFGAADIRGADFSDACLAGANFSGAMAGLKRSWVVLLRVSVVFLAFLSGFVSAYSGAFIGSYLIEIQTLAGLLFSVLSTLVVFLAFVITTLWRGLGTELWVFVVMTMAAITFMMAFPGMEAARILTVLLVLVVAVNGASVVMGSIAIATCQILGERRTLIGVAIATLLAIPLGLYTGNPPHTWGSTSSAVWSLVIAVPVIAALVGLSLYAGLGAIANSPKYALIKQVATIWCSKGGTCFCRADLTDVDFSYATLQHTDLRDAQITRTNWFQAKHITRARLEDTYLENPKIRQLVISKQGQEQNFDHLDLRGLNLDQTQLTDASFIGTKLSEATLRAADLTRTNLVQTQLYGANLNNAVLTGANIQDWSLSLDTQLDNILCDYVYTRLPTRANLDPCRKPDNNDEIFAPGDFTDFIAPIIKTLDLYRNQNVDPRALGRSFKTLDLFHKQGIDPGAAAIALQQLNEQYPEANLKVIALEGRGDEKIRLQTQISGSSDSSLLSREYTEKYEQISSLSHGNVQGILASNTEKDKHILRLEEMLTVAIQSNKFYVEMEQPPPVKSILLLAANPKGTSVLRLGEEARELQIGLERSRYRDRFTIHQRWAVTATDVRRALLDCKPAIVHFSGHGVGTERLDSEISASRKFEVLTETITPVEGLMFENESGQPQLVTTEALANLFALFAHHIECVVLNACFSETQANAIAHHISYVVGMKRAIGDQAAIEFAIGFYDALLAGESVDFAYKLGCSAIQIEGIPEHLTPVLKQRLSLS